jgi:hypothetical protein
MRAEANAAKRGYACALAPFVVWNDASVTEGDLGQIQNGLIDSHSTW